MMIWEEPNELDVILTCLVFLKVCSRWRIICRWWVCCFQNHFRRKSLENEGKNGYKVTDYNLKIYMIVSRTVTDVSFLFFLTSFPLSSGVSVQKSSAGAISVLRCLFSKFSTSVVMDSKSCLSAVTIKGKGWAVVFSNKVMTFTYLTYITWSWCK